MRGVILKMVCRQSLRVSLVAVAFLISAPAFAIPEKDTGNLGEIRQSVLSPENFQRIYGEGWVLMDGRDVTGTDLYRERLWETAQIPDARGVYLRGKNYDRSTGTGDPNGNRTLGDYMSDEIHSHTHTDAGHGHGHDFYTNTTHGEGGSAPSRGAGSSWGKEALQGSLHTGHASIQATGGSETRPRSIVVNTYIKVNRTPESKQLNRILEAIERLPERLFQNGAFAQFIRRVVPGADAAARELEANRALEEKETPALLEQQ